MNEATGNKKEKKKKNYHYRYYIIDNVSKLADQPTLFLYHFSFLLFFPTFQTVIHPNKHSFNYENNYSYNKDTKTIVPFQNQKKKKKKKKRKETGARNDSQRRNRVKIYRKEGGVKLKTHLGQLLALVVRQQRPQRLETGVNALHPTSFIAVGDFSPHTLLLLHMASRCDAADVAGTVPVAQRNVLTSNTAGCRAVALRLLLLLLLRISDLGDRHARGHRALLYRSNASVNTEIPCFIANQSQFCLVDLIKLDQIKKISFLDLSVNFSLEYFAQSAATKSLPTKINKQVCDCSDGRHLREINFCLMFY